MAKKKDDKIDLLTKVATGVAFGDTSNSAVRNILTEISKELYGRISNDQMHETMEFFEWKCPYTGVDMHALISKGDYATDHIYPQNQDWCGLNVQGNLILVDKSANNAKKGLDVETFLLTDTKVLSDIDNGKTRQERLDKIRAFQTKFKYEPERIRKVVRPLMEERYKIIREEQESCIRDVLAKLDTEGIKPVVSKSASTKTTAPRSGDAIGNGYTYSEKLTIAAYYLREGEGLVQVEENCMKLTGRNGATAKYILNKLGLDTSRKSAHKGLLAKSDSSIDDEIAKATGTFKITLQEIKKRGLI